MQGKECVKLVAQNYTTEIDTTEERRSLPKKTLTATWNYLTAIFFLQT
ncbi:hypothetical protein [Nostoc sp. LEGE 12450]|nr:hypothetical protein [Nostoc sp. LEGE 12450]MBE8991931.1 hypothetical protein [Nostoc sp. LEGE 12450]